MAKEELKLSHNEIRAPAFFKVFYITEALLNDSSNNLKLECFYHPGRNGLAWFITRGDEALFEVVEFSEPRRSWLINSDICSNGRIYMTTPIDVTFLALHHLRKYCIEKAMELETIHDEQDTSVKRLMTNFMSNANLSCIADIKVAGGMTFYKYNSSKTLGWLAIKTKRLAAFLKNAGIHCGRSALSQNYMRSDKATEEPEQAIDFLRMAHDIICGYLDLELHTELSKYLDIPTEAKNANDDKDKNGKRKSLTTLKATKNKKIKVNTESKEDDTDAIEKLKGSAELDESMKAEKEEKKGVDLISTSPVIPNPTPLKERILTAKEKKLAIGAKGTKSIASFFKKKD